VLLVAAYIDLDRNHPVEGYAEIQFYPRVILFKIDDGYLRLSVDEGTDQIMLRFSADALPASELLDEPSVEPVFIDFTENFLGDTRPARVTSVSLLVDQFSDPERGIFRGLVLHQGQDEGLAVDPYSFLGMRLGILPDLGKWMSGLAGVESREILIAS